MFLKENFLKIQRYPYHTNAQKNAHVHPQNQTKNQTKNHPHTHHQHLTIILGERKNKGTELAVALLRYLLLAMP